MNTSDTAVVLREWRSLTDQETTALRAEDWARVGACQQAKAQLQIRLRDLPDTINDPGTARFLEDLIRAEMANQRWLGEQLQSLGHARRQLDGSAGNLRRLRHSYGSPSAANWHSYS